MGRQRETIVAERKNVVWTAGTTPLTLLLLLRFLDARFPNKKRHEIIRDGILARMKPDQNYGETAACL